MVEPLDPSRLIARVGRGAPGEIEGFVFDPLEPWRRFVVELRFDGIQVAIATAERYTHELAETESDGGHGFVFAEPTDGADVAVIEVFLANSDIRIGEPIEVPFIAVSPKARPQAEVTWRGGLRLNGLVDRGATDDDAQIFAFVDGECVAKVRLERWAPRVASTVAGAARQFDLWLPEAFADGALRRVHVRDDTGRELRGSPCVVIAFADGIASFLGALAPTESADPRILWFGRVCPQSLPFSAFSAHRELFRALRPELAVAPRVAVALVGEADLDRSLASLEEQRNCVWTAGVLADGGTPLAFSPADLEAFLKVEAADVEAVVFAPGGAIFEPDALAAFAGALQEAPSADIAFGDFCVRGSEGGLWPLAHGAFDYERVLEQGTGALLFAIRPSVARAALSAGAADLFRLFNFPLDRIYGPLASNPSSEAAPIHVPGIVASLRLPDARQISRRLAAATAAHLAARGVADCETAAEFGDTFPAARVRRTNSHLTVTIVTLGQGSVETVAATLRAASSCLGAVSGEAVVVAPLGSPEYARLADGQVRTLEASGPLSMLRAANLAATAASGDLLWLLAPGLEAREAGVLEELVGRITETDVGAVAPMLIGPDGRIAALGYALGVDFSVTPRFSGNMPDAAIYGGVHRTAHACSAVPMPGVLLRRDLFRRLQGFDIRRFPQRYAEVDFSLRLRAMGSRILVSPHARLHASTQRPIFPSPPPWDPIAGRPEPDWDLGRLRARWGEALVADPAYSPLLTLAGDAYSGLAWPPRALAPRLPVISRPSDAPSEW